LSWLADGASSKPQTPKMLKDELWWADEIFHGSIVLQVIEDVREDACV
jgi:hypothetical protein